MASLLFHILLVFLLSGTCSSSYTQHITIQVSDTGVDEPSCMQNGETCKTLTYVLNELSNFNQSSTAITVITVNITCNQTIKKDPACLLSSKYFLSVKIVGHNEAYISLNSSITIINYAIGNDMNVNWAWIGLGFISDRDHTNLNIRHHLFNSLAILNCSIMTGEWEFDNIQNSVIKSSTFGQVETCPTLSILFAYRFTFSNNTISDCSTDKSILNFNAMQVTPPNCSYVAIMNCTFTKLKGIKTTGEVASTSNQKNIMLQADSKLISVNTKNHFILSINKSRFIDNKYLILVSQIVYHSDGVHPKRVILDVYDTIMRNNLVTSVLVEGIKRFVIFSKMAIVLKGILVDGNTVTNTQCAYAISIGALQSSIFSFSDVDEILIEDSSFSNNQGTPLKVNDNARTSLSLQEEIHFTNNTGVLGGACGLHNIRLVIQTNTEGNIIFEGNTGVYGGALYLNHAGISDKMCKIKVKFINNTATKSGNSVYFATMARGVVPNCSFNDIQLTDIRSQAFNMTYEGENVFSLIPGQNIYINVSVMDYYGSPSSCTADIYLTCDNWVFICSRKHIQLNGPNHVVLAQKEIGAYTEVDTKLNISAPLMLRDTTVDMLLICPNAGLSLKLNISTTCPLGFVYNTSEGVCKCANITTNHGTVICSENLGIACITQGYWYGPFIIDNTTTHVSAQCSYPDCSYSYKPCPARMLSLGFAGDYKLLGIDADEQCSVGRGGLLCKSCTEDYQYTFLSVSCVAISTCEWWQPYIVLVITLVFQLMIAMVLMSIVRFKIAAGSGFLYGPMLFLAIISHLPLDNDPNLFILREFILIITAVPLLNPEPFGLIPWCFFYPFNKIYNYSLRYLGPLTVLLVIGFTTLKARWCPRTLLKWQNSRLRALCILMLLSFWSLADITMNITFNILTSTRLIHNNDVVVSVVALEPHIKYLSLEHIPIVILALLVLLIVIVPLLIVLLISPALSRVINLTRIKPFLDEFQSCYRDSCRWYSIVYFIVWIGFVSMQSQAVPMIYIQALFVILLSTHCLIRPYQSTILNITDTLILIDVNFLLALMQSKTNLTMTVFIHILVLVPILGIGTWFVCLSCVKSGVFKCLHRVLVKKGQQPLAASREQCYEELLPSPPNVPVQEIHLYESNEEREPLIGIVDDN